MKINLSLDALPNTAGPYLVELEPSFILGPPQTVPYPGPAQPLIITLLDIHLFDELSVVRAKVTDTASGQYAYYSLTLSKAGCQPPVISIARVSSDINVTLTPGEEGHFRYRIVVIEDGVVTSVDRNAFGNSHAYPINPAAGTVEVRAYNQCGDTSSVYSVYSSAVDSI